MTNENAARQTANADTVALVYQESVKSIDTLAGWYEKLDAKVVTVFGVAQVIAAIAPALVNNRPAGVHIIPWIGALIAWGVAVGHCIVAFLPRDYRLDPNPDVLATAEWLAVTPDQFRAYRLEDVAKTYRTNRSAYLVRTAALNSAIQATAAEVLCIAIALLVGAS